jgi:hypothetical protein
MFFLYQYNRTYVYVLNIVPKITIWNDEKYSIHHFVILVKPGIKQSCNRYCTAIKK